VALAVAQVPNVAIVSIASKQKADHHQDLKINRLGLRRIFIDEITISSH